MSVEPIPIENIPEGCKHLYGTLFMVPFKLLVTPDPESEAEDGEYKFKNPRLHTERGQADLLDKKLSAELRESIRVRTLLNPLVCRWAKDEAGSLFPQVVGGDRRYRAMDFLIRKKEIVTDPRSLKLDDNGEWVYSQCSADKAYEMIVCQVFACNTDLDALALAWAENKGRINLTEGHEIAEVMKLRKAGATDERILEILQQDEKWLAESDNLINDLDVDTLGDLLEGRITRLSAKELITIKDVDLRSKVRIAANNASQEACDRKVQRLQKQVLSALDQKEIAEGSVADAEFNEDEAAADQARNEVAEADKKVSRVIKERDSVQPVTSAKEVRQAVAEINGEEIDDRPIRILSAKKIKAGLEYLDTLISSDGNCPDGNFAVSVQELQLVRNIIEINILGNESDFSTTIQRHFDETSQQ